MARSLVRIAALAAALAFPAAAFATPSTPHLLSVPTSVLPGPVTVTWWGSTFDYGFPHRYYRLTVADYAFGSTDPTYEVFTINSTAPRTATFSAAGLHRYLVSVVAVQMKLSPPEVQVSAPDTAPITAWVAPADPPRKG